MSEITDKDLASIYSSLSSCSPLVRGLAERLRRVEGELATASSPRLAKYQPCGCVVCTCADDDQCQGCGAKCCNTHEPFEIPNPVYEPHPLVAENTALRERVKRMEEALQGVVNPLGYLQKEAAREGKVLSGMAVTISKDPEFLKEIAQAALKEGGNERKAAGACH